jgi:hypothetical protein
LLLLGRALIGIIPVGKQARNPAQKLYKLRARFFAARAVCRDLEHLNDPVSPPTMTRTFLLVLNVMAAVCMIVAVPLLLTLLLAIGVLQGARAVARKIEHRQPPWIGVRRKARRDLYPETALRDIVKIFNLFASRTGTLRLSRWTRGDAAPGMSRACSKRIHQGRKAGPHSPSDVIIRETWGARFLVLTVQAR